MRIRKQKFPKSTLSSSFAHSFFSWLSFVYGVLFFHLPSCVYLAGIRSWDTNLIDCNLDQELKLFVSRHSARFSADVKGKLELKEALIAQQQSDDDCSCICKPNLIHPTLPPPSLPPSLSVRVEKYRCVPGAATAHLKF